MPNNKIEVTVSLVDRASKELKHLESSIIRTVGSISAAFASVKAVLFPVTESAAFQREMANVAKTTGFAQKDIDRLSKSLVRLSHELGTSAEELAQVAAIAGQLGLGTEGRKAIEAFTASVARASETLGMTVEQTAEAGAQLSAIFGKSVADVERVFSTINELSNNSVAAGSDLVDIMKRVGTTANVTFEQVAALSATMRQLGVPNEQAGTALVKFLGNMLAESEKFAKAMGKTQAEWVAEVKRDAIKAFKDVLTQLSRMGEAESAALTKQLFGSGRLFSAASKLIKDAGKNFEVLNKMLEISAKGYQEGTSSIDEYNRIMQTLVKQVDVLKTSFTALGLEVGSRTLKQLTDSVKKLSVTLQDKDVVDYFARIGNGFASLVSSISDAISYVASLNIEWRNVITTLKLFVEFQIAKVFLRWASALTHLLTPLKTLNGVMVGLVAKAGLMAASFGEKWAEGFSIAGKASKEYQQTARGTLAVIQQQAVRTNTMAQLNKRAMASVAKEIASFAPLYVRVGRSIALTGSLIANSAKRIVAALTGPLGLAALIAFDAGLFDPLLKALGFVSSEEDKLNKELQRRAQERRKILEEEIADAEEYVSKIRSLFAENGSDLVASQKIKLPEYGLQLGSKEYKKYIVDLAKTVATLTNALDANQKAVKALEVRWEEYKNNAEAAKTKIAELKEKIVSLQRDINPGRLAFLPKETRQRLVSSTEEQIANLKETIRQLEEQQANAEKGMSLMSAKLRELGLASVQATTALDNLYGPAFFSRFDEATKRYIQVQALFQKERDKIGKLRQEYENLKQEIEKNVSEGTIVPKEEIDRLNVLESELFNAEQTTERWRKALSTLKLGLDPAQLDLINQFQDFDTSTLQTIAKVLDEVSVTDVSKPASDMLSLAANAAFAVAKAKVLKQSFKTVSDAAAAMAKRMQSVFDNTATEVVSLNRKMEAFASNMRETLKSRRIQLKLDIRTEEIKKWYEEEKRRIEDYYNARIAIADKATKARLEQLKKEKLEELDIQRIRKEADAKAEEYTAQFNRQLRLTTELIRRANAAAASGKLDEAMALKEDAKSSIQEVRNLIKDISKLETKDLSGKLKFKFDDAAISRFLSQAQQATSQLSKGIIDVNRTAKDVAKESADKWTTVATKIDSSFKTAETVASKFEEVFGSSFTNAVNELEQAMTDGTGAWASLLRDFHKTFENFRIASANPLQAASTINPDDIYRLFSEGSQKAFAELGPQLSSTLIPELADAYQKAFSQPLALDTTQFGKALSGELASQILEAFNQIQVAPKVDTSNLKQQIENIDAELRHAKIQEVEIKKLVYKGKPIELPGFAGGGPVVGPGTGTSDSILSWLSNGEYVIDAVTTRFFGSSFFAGLQSIAKRGRTSGSVLRGLPAYSKGGPVAGAASVGYITLNLGGEEFSLYTERKKAEELVDIFKRISS